MERFQGSLGAPWCPMTRPIEATSTSYTAVNGIGRPAWGALGDAFIASPFADFFMVFFLLVVWKQRTAFGAQPTCELFSLFRILIMLF